MAHLQRDELFYVLMWIEIKNHVDLLKITVSLYPYANHHTLLQVETKASQMRCRPFVTKSTSFKNHPILMNKKKAIHFQPHNNKSNNDSCILFPYDNYLEKVVSNVLWCKTMFTFYNTLTLWNTGIGGGSILCCKTTPHAFYRRIKPL